MPSVLRVKLVFICSYVLGLFLLLRLLDVSRLAGGFNQWQGVLEPSSLSASVLKEVLQDRGIRYDNVLEKSELVDLVKKSGHVRPEDVENLLPSEKNMAEVVRFNSSAHYDQEVKFEDVWLILVTTSRNEADWARLPFLEKTWWSFRHRLSRYNIRVGICDCSLDPVWCRIRRWNTSRLFLLIPHAKSRGAVKYEHTGAFSRQQIYTWILESLQDQLTLISSPADLKSRWLTFDSALQQPELHVVILTNQTRPPPFILALGAQYRGWARFGWVRSKNIARWIKNVDIEVGDLTLPLILFSTSEVAYVYGQMTGECYTYSCLKTFLDYFKPSQTVAVIGSFLVAILLGLLNILIYNKQLLMRIWHDTKISLYAVVLLWGIVYLYDTKHIARFMTTLIIRASRIMAMTRLGALIRSDIVFLVHHHYVLLFSLPCAVLLMVMLRSKLLGDGYEKEELPQVNGILIPDIQRPTAAEQREPQPITYRIERMRGEEPQGQPQRIPFRIVRRYEGGPVVVQDDPFVIRLNLAHREGLLTQSGRDPADLPEWPFGTDSQVPEEFMATHQQQCVICLEEFSQHDQMTGLPCRHIFHFACLSDWLKEGVSRSCPVCRSL